MSISFHTEEKSQGSESITLQQEKILKLMTNLNTNGKNNGKHQGFPICQ